MSKADFKKALEEKYGKELAENMTRETCPDCNTKLITCPLCDGRFCPNCEKEC